MGKRTNLAGDTSGDDDDLNTFEGLVELVGGVALDLEHLGSALYMLRCCSLAHLAVGVNMANIGSNTGGAADIIEAQRGDERVVLEEQRERLANSSTGAENGDLGPVDRRRRELSRRRRQDTGNVAGQHF